MQNTGYKYYLVDDQSTKATVFVYCEKKLHNILCTQALWGSFEYFLLSPELIGNIWKTHCIATDALDEENQGR